MTQLNRILSVSDLGESWYTTNAFPGAEKVTNHSSNPELFIDDINFSIRNDKGKPNYLGTAYVRMCNGNVGFGGHMYLTDAGYLRFSPFQNSYTDQQGNVRYVDIVHPSLAVSAQVLNRAQSLLGKKEVAVQQQNTQQQPQQSQSQPAQNNQTNPAPQNNASMQATNQASGFQQQPQNNFNGNAMDTDNLPF